MPIRHPHPSLQRRPARLLRGLLAPRRFPPQFRSSRFPEVRDQLLSLRLRRLPPRNGRQPELTASPKIPGFLLLEDGTLFRGRIAQSQAERLRASGATPTVAEVVFSTNMTGYQEMFTDPSFDGQIVVMTAPQIGNYGINSEDPESGHPQIAGVVVRELSATYSNWRATGDLETWLANSDVPILQDVDTRRLTRHLRSAGVMRGVVAAGSEPGSEARAGAA